MPRKAEQSQISAQVSCCVQCRHMWLWLLPLYRAGVRCCRLGRRDCVQMILFYDLKKEETVIHRREQLFTVLQDNAQSCSTTQGGWAVPSAAGFLCDAAGVTQGWGSRGQPPSQLPAAAGPSTARCPALPSACSYADLLEASTLPHSPGKCKQEISSCNPKQKLTNFPPCIFNCCLTDQFLPHPPLHSESSVKGNCSELQTLPRLQMTMRLAFV